MKLIPFQWNEWENWTERSNHARGWKPLLICLHETDTYRENTLHLQTICMTSDVAGTVTVGTEIIPGTTYQVRCEQRRKKKKRERSRLPIPCHFLKLKTVFPVGLKSWAETSWLINEVSILSQGILELFGLKSISEPIKSHSNCSKTISNHKRKEKTTRFQKQHGLLHGCTVRFWIRGALASISFIYSFIYLFFWLFWFIHIFSHILYTFCSFWLHWPLLKSAIQITLNWFELKIFFILSQVI